MTAPKTGENVCRRTPSQSAHVPILATLVDDALADVEDHSADYVDQPMTTTHQVASGQTGHAESRMESDATTLSLPRPDERCRG
jgi:hypothetical protein